MKHEHRRPTGDSECEQWLKRAIDRHECLLVRYAQQFVGDVDRARDVVQDTFLKLHKYDQSNDRLVDKSLKRWLLRVCRNRAIDVARKENRMKVSPPNEFDERVGGRTSSPDDLMIQEERQQTLLLQIARLPARQQEVLRLKFHAGLSYQEIAEVTGLTKTNVGFLLHTAISKLRQRVATSE